MRKLQVNEATFSVIIETLNKRIDDLKTDAMREIHELFDVSEYHNVSQRVNNYLSEIMELQSVLDILYEAKYIPTEDD